MKARKPVYHQVTIDEYIRNQEPLFPEVVTRSPDAKLVAIPAGPLFPGAIDGVGAAPEVDNSVKVARSPRRVIR